MTETPERRELGLFQQKRLLWCGNEQTWTPHVKTVDGQFWVCACGERVPASRADTESKKGAEHGKD